MTDINTAYYALRRSATEPGEGLHLDRLETFLGFIAARLSADDMAEAISLLHAAIDPVHAVRRQQAPANDGLFHKTVL